MLQQIQKVKSLHKKLLQTATPSSSSSYYYYYCCKNITLHQNSPSTQPQQPQMQSLQCPQTLNYQKPQTFQCFWSQTFDVPDRYSNQLKLHREWEEKMERLNDKYGLDCFSDSELYSESDEGEEYRYKHKYETLI